ncbi:dihydrolipoamide acetyltransferase family protein [Desulfosediminicola ganghwensis]|uniref:dihydrolipoamide acetyltransferase family protein n=1 Tax=Desulfosediminicola ganghwensis TaxID=2569540 RepID=UPI0010ABD2A5|nr:dihydrolipoamide acetyltransferase family protein [Desulfosediminicola ganghwensis]
MTSSFRLPDLGEGVHEAEILAVAVTEGQKVAEGDLILEVETDKAAVEIPSPTTGTVTEIHVTQGEIAKVGDILITFDGSAATDEAEPAKISVEQEAVQGAEPAREPAADTRAEARERQATVQHPPDRPVPAAPSTRRLARELGVDLHQVSPTGPNGIVTAEDVRNFAQSGGSVNLDQNKMVLQTASEHCASFLPVEPLPDFSQFGEVERQPFRSIRRATAIRMSASWSQIPHVNCQDIVDITRLEEFRQRHKDIIRANGGRLTMTVFALKAVATALKAYPHFNASLDLPKQEIIIKKYFHIGVAVDTEHGLMVPVIRDVDRKSIKELSVELHEAINRARERKSGREELIGGSFTITNAGAIGGSHFSAIINYPEIAILGLGQSRMQPAVITEGGKMQIVPRLQMPIVLCFDHRVADGADAIRFMQVIIKALEDPDELLISMI